MQTPSRTYRLSGSERKFPAIIVIMVLFGYSFVCPFKDIHIRASIKKDTLVWLPERFYLFSLADGKLVVARDRFKLSFKHFFILYFGK